MTATPYETRPVLDERTGPRPESGPGARLDLVARVVGAARTELCQRQDLSVRAVARRAGVDPGEVVRHVGPRDELVRRIFFEIVVDAREAMAASSRVPAAASCRDRLLGYARGYRAWALANPVEFTLAFGPTSRPLLTETVAGPALSWFYGPLLDILWDGAARGHLEPVLGTTRGRARPVLRPGFLAAAQDLEPRLALAFATLTTGMHGYLVLEGCGQLGAVYLDLDRAYDAHVRVLIDAAGIA